MNKLEAELEVIDDRISEIDRELMHYDENKIASAMGSANSSPMFPSEEAKNILGEK